MVKLVKQHCKAGRTQPLARVGFEEVVFLQSFADRRAKDSRVRLSNQAPFFSFAVFIQWRRRR